MELNPNEVAILVKRGPIFAIKAYRERTGMGLRESKDAVDSYAIALDMRVSEPCTYCNGSGKVYRYKNGAGRGF